MDFRFYAVKSGALVVTQIYPSSFSMRIAESERSSINLEIPDLGNYDTTGWTYITCSVSRELSFSTVWENLITVLIGEINTRRSANGVRATISGNTQHDFTGYFSWLASAGDNASWIAPVPTIEKTLTGVSDVSVTGGVVTINAEMLSSLRPGHYAIYDSSGSRVYVRAVDFKVSPDSARITVTG